MGISFYHRTCEPSSQTLQFVGWGFGTTLPCCPRVPKIMPVKIFYAIMLQCLRPGDVMRLEQGLS